AGARPHLPYRTADAEPGREMGQRTPPDVGAQPRPAGRLPRTGRAGGRKMRKLVALMHVSLDGYCAGPKGEMNWITLNDAIFADVHAMIAGTGAAVYGRTTYGMMRGYWPTLLDKEDADPEQRKHAHWVEK